MEGVFAAIVVRSPTTAQAAAHPGVRVLATADALLPRVLRGAVFDLDGTLLDTEPAYAEAAQRVIDAHGNGRRYLWDTRRRVVGKAELVGGAIIAETFDLGMSGAEYLALRDVHLEALFPDTPAMPGAEWLTRELRAAGVPIAIATSSWKKFLDLKTTRHLDWFRDTVDAVVCGDDPRVRAGKPAPDIFLAAAAEISCAPEECIAFEDAVTGVQAAKAAGMLVVGIPHAESGMGEEMAACGVDALLDSLASFPREWIVRPAESCKGSDRHGSEREAE